MNGRRSSWAPGRRLVGLTLLASLLVVTGCKSRGSVSGKVTYRGAPVTGGYVYFVPESGGTGGSAQLNPQDGTYTVENLPPGKYKVAVQPLRQTPGAPGGGGPGRMGGGPPKGMLGPPKDSKLPEGVDPSTFDPGKRGGKAVQIPEKYQETDTSGWTFEVKKGANTYDITVPES